MRVERIKAVLFDYGGTLDSDGVPWVDRLPALYKEAGIDAPIEALRKAFHDADEHLAARFDLRGLGLEETILRQTRCVVDALASGEDSLAERIAGAFVDGCRAAIRRNIPLLKRLRRRYRLGIVSNFYGNLDSVLAGEGLAGYFDAVADSGKLGVVKPEAGIFLDALDRLGVRPDEACMVGDTLHRDMLGAEALGMPHAWLMGTHSESERCCPGVAVLKTLSDLEPLLLRTRPRSGSRPFLYTRAESGERDHDKRK